jgi:hypothetical protein
MTWLAGAAELALFQFDPTAAATWNQYVPVANAADVHEVVALPALATAKPVVADVVDLKTL